MDKRWLIGPIRPLYLGTVGDDHHPLWEAFKTWREDMHWMEWLAGLCHTAGKPTSECWGLKINMTRWNHPYSSLTWGWLNRQQNMDSQRDAILGTARRNMPPPRLTANPGVQIIRFAASFWHVVSESKETFVWKYGTQKKPVVENCLVSVAILRMHPIFRHTQRVPTLPLRPCLVHVGLGVCPHFLSEKMLVASIGCINWLHQLVASPEFVDIPNRHVFQLCLSWYNLHLVSLHNFDCFHPILRVKYLHFCRTSLVALPLFRVSNRFIYPLSHTVSRPSLKSS
jgi:hypothetical protein